MFDMGGVVTSTFDMNEMYNKLQMSQNAFFDFCKFDDIDIWHELQIGHISVLEFWKRFNTKRAELKMDEIHNDLFRLYFHPVLNKGTVSVINNLRQNNRVICATNTIESHWENHMERGDYLYFDQTYASNKIGEIKPDENFFKVILEAEGVTPENAFFTDDRVENCDAATRLGINTYHFDNAENLAQYIMNLKK